MEAACRLSIRRASRYTATACGMRAAGPAGRKCPVVGLPRPPARRRAALDGACGRLRTWSRRCDLAHPRMQRRIRHPGAPRRTPGAPPANGQPSARCSTRKRAPPSPSVTAEQTCPAPVASIRNASRCASIRTGFGLPIDPSSERLSPPDPDGTGLASPPDLDPEPPPGGSHRFRIRRLSFGADTPSPGSALERPPPPPG
jgi:hypothetical protein